MNFQEIILRLQNFWAGQGCIIQQPYDVEKGAGTMNPATFLRALGPEPWKVAYVEPSRRPTDGRYGENPNRLQHYYQYQVILKPSPDDVIDLYLQSLMDLGIDPQQAMFIQNRDSVYDIEWVDGITYADVHHQAEVDYSHYNFEQADVASLMTMFNLCEKEALQVMKAKLVQPAYDYVLKCSHLFNLLDARGAISVTERTGYIGRVRNLARMVAAAFLEQRRNLGYPLIKDPALREQLINSEEAI